MADERRAAVTVLLTREEYDLVHEAIARSGLPIGDAPVEEWIRHMALAAPELRDALVHTSQLLDSCTSDRARPHPAMVRQVLATARALLKTVDGKEG